MPLVTRFVHSGCTKRQSFAAKGRGKKDEFSSEDCKDGMKCGHSGCTTRPSFGSKGSKKAESGGEL